MPLASVQTYVKSLLDGTQLPLGLGTLAAYITPPDPGESTEPAVYIWGSVAKEQRQSMPRHKPGQYSTGGFVWIKHTIDLWLLYCMYEDDPNIDQSYPGVIDFIQSILRDTLMPVQNLYDQVTGQLSHLMAIGEDMTWDYAPVHSLADQRMLRFTARRTVDIKELIQS